MIRPADAPVRSPIAALKARVSEIDHSVFDEGRLPTVAEWSAVAEMVGKLDASTSVNVAGSDGGPLPARATNVVAFKPRGR